MSIMMKRFIISFLALVAGGVYAPAMAQTYPGTIPSGYLLANPSAAEARPTGASLTNLFDRAIGSSNGMFPLRVGGVWSSGTFGAGLSLSGSTLTVQFANPSASCLGLTVINGSASSAMRSDAALALCQNISPTWTGSHTFTNQIAGTSQAFSMPITSVPPDIGGAENANSYRRCSSDNVAASAFILCDAVRYVFGGSSMTGGRAAFYAIAAQNATSSASSTNRNYVGSVGIMYTNSGDGGTNTSTGAKGAYFGMNPYVQADAGATNMFDFTSQEADTLLCPTCSTRYLRTISVVGANAAHGSEVDAAISMSGSAQGGYTHIGWKHGLLFTDVNGVNPFYSSSTVLGTYWQNAVPTVTNGVDFGDGSSTGLLFTGNAFRSKNFTVDGNGIVTSQTTGGGSASNFTAKSSAPSFGLSNTSAGADSKTWDIIPNATTLIFRTVNDANSSQNTWLQATRSGIAILEVAVPNSALRLGTAGSVLGSLTFAGNTSGTMSLNGPAAASGTATLVAGTYNLVGDSLSQALTNKTYNGLTVTTTTGTLTIANGKTLTANNSLNLSGTDGKTLTLTNALTVSGNDGTLSFGAASKTLTVNNSLAFSGTDGTTMTMPGASDTLAGLGTTQTFTKQNIFSAASTVASAAGAALDDLKVAVATTTLTGTTTVTKLAKVGLYQPTLTDSSAVTVTDAATLYVDNAPAAAGSVTISNPWALLIGAGASKLQATTINGALTYGGTTLANSVTGTGSMVLSTAPSITGGMGVTGQLAVVNSTSSGAMGQLMTITQTTPHASDTTDSALGINYTLSASSATNEFVARLFSFSFTNSLTGGGVFSNARLVNLTTNTSTSTTTTNLEAIWIEAGTASGTVTNGYGLHISGLQGTTKWGVADDVSGSNWYNNGYIRTGSTTVASLPTCNSTAKGARHFVTDSNSTTYHTTVAGGGANNVAVTCDGTNWYIS